MAFSSLAAFTIKSLLDLRNPCYIIIVSVASASFLSNQIIIETKDHIIKIKQSTCYPDTASLVYENQMLSPWWMHLSPLVHWYVG